MPNWPITRLTRRNAAASPADETAAVITAETVRGLRRVAAAGPAAAARGLRSGQALTDARALCPDLVAVEADAAADLAALAVLAGWCERYTPMAAPDPPDGLWLDVTGAAHLFGGEQALADDLADRLARAGIPCRIAIAGTPGAAWALARSLLGQDRAVLGPGRERTSLAGLPVAALRLDPRCVAGLRRIGLRTVGELARVPRAELTARFGEAPVRQMDQAFGAAPEAIAWPHPAAPWVERLAFAEPIGTPEDLARALGLLATRLCARLEAERAGAHRIVARFFRVDDITERCAVATALPVRDAAYLTRLLTERLDTVDPGFGVEVMTLTAETVAPLRPTMRSLGEIGAEPTARLATTVDTLVNRLGQERVWRPVPQASHVPERAVRRTCPLDPADAAAERRDWAVDDPDAAPRPVRLLRRPEPIEATAPVPDDPPVLFRWRGVLHRVRAATGPERISAEWWRTQGAEDAADDTDRVRDYYRVEDEHGARFWIFRRGLSGASDWFLHGLFA